MTMTKKQWAAWIAKRVAKADAIEAETPGFRFFRNTDGTPQMGGACPWQADGYVNDQACYLRFRHNQASMTVYDRDFDRWHPGDEKEILSSVIHPYYLEGHPEHHVHTGSPLDEDVAEMINRLVAELAPVSDENPSGLMIMGQQVDALTAKIKSGELVLKVNGKAVADDEELPPGFSTFSYEPPDEA